MLVRLLYASRAASTLSAEAIDTIMLQSRRNNPERGITGMLCYSDDIFLQVLEGGRDDVCEIFTAIVRDERNAHVRILSFEEIEERRFGNWTMGQVNITKINPALLLKYNTKPVLNPFTCSGRASLALLEELIATASLVSRGN